MKWIAGVAVLLAGILGLAGSATAASLVRITPDGFLNSDPSFLTAPSGDSRVFLAERGDSTSHQAQIRLFKDGTPVSEPFLTIPNVDLASERGLLSIAFAPDYATSGLLYAFYVAHGSDSLDPAGQAGDIRIVEYKASTTDPDRADPASARLVYEVPHSAGNHNGGWMAFGPDGHLYFSIGDNANSANAQSLANVYGKIVRIDPADPPGPDAYSIPADNPFIGEPGAKTEIYALGLRNPYRASFAPDGRLVIGDVGNGTWEEVDAGDLKGANLGWPTCEGFCTGPTPSFVAPVFAYNHNNSVDGFGGGCAILGGYVVRDTSLGDLAGRYLYGDLCNRALRSLNLDAPGGDFKLAGLGIPSNLGNLRSFGEDSKGCVYVLSDEAVFRVAADGVTGTACGSSGPPVGDPPVDNPPDPPVDITYNSFIPHRATIGRSIKVAARCSIDCQAGASATVKISRNRFRRKPLTFKLVVPARSLAAGARGSLVFKVPAKRVRAMKKSASNGSKINARVKVTLVGDDGSGGSGESTIHLVRPKRR